MSTDLKLPSYTGFIPVYTATVRRSRSPDLLTHRYSEHRPADIEFKQPRLPTRNTSAVPQILGLLQLDMYNIPKEQEFYDFFTTSLDIITLKVPVWKKLCMQLPTTNYLVFSNKFDNNPSPVNASNIVPTKAPARTNNPTFPNQITTENVNPI